MSSTFTRTAALALVLAGASLAVTKAHCGEFYGQADLGRTTIDESIDADGFIFGLDESATAYRLALGYEWSPWFSVEAGYNDLGKVDADLGFAGVEAEADGFELGLVLRWPVGERFSLNARAGYLWWDAVTRVAAVRADDSGEDAFAGIGAEFHASERLAITLGWNRYRLDDLDADQATVGLRIRFGGAD
jgi:OOP family OmpA-OmpF porin